MGRVRCHSKRRPPIRGVRRYATAASQGASQRAAWNCGAAKRVRGALRCAARRQTEGLLSFEAKRRATGPSASSRRCRHPDRRGGRRQPNSDHAVSRVIAGRRWRSTARGYFRQLCSRYFAQAPRVRQRSGHGQPDVDSRNVNVSEGYAVDDVGGQPRGDGRACRGERARVSAAGLLHTPATPGLHAGA